MTLSALEAAFEQRYGAPPALVTRAPGRVNLIGEHVDHQAGLCLPIALEQATFAAVRPRADRLVRLASTHTGVTWEGVAADVAPGQVEGWPAYAVGVLRLLHDGGYDVPGLDLLVDSTLPVGAGLSSSAALECAVGVAAVAVAGGEVDRDEVRRDLVRAGIRAEREFAGAPTGGMDQTAAMFGRAGHALLLDCRDDTVDPVPLELPGHELLVIDTRVRHALVDGQYADRRTSCEAAAALLGVASLREVADRDPAAVDSLDDERLRARGRHVVTEIGRTRAAAVALRGGDVPGLAALLLASHASLRDDFEVSCAELDVAVDAACASGALGARMTGGGFGGSAVALLPREVRSEVVSGVRAAFASRGWGEPAFLPVVAADGAGVVRRRQPAG